MRRYFFHVLDGRSAPDVCGTELLNDNQALLEAVRLAGAILNGEPWSLIDSDDWSLRVTTDTDLTIFEMHFMITRAAAMLA